MLAIVDTGCANLASVAFAFDRLGADKIITKDRRKIQGADHVILPGVGAMPFAMAALKERGLIEVLQNLKQPVMGICLGLQLLYETSEEGSSNGIGLLAGGAQKMKTGELPLPHMGWNTLEGFKDDNLLQGIEEDAYVYFVHSYAVPCGTETLARCTYANPFSAIIRRGNIYGCQFHPERSGKTGAKILENFLKVKL
ncbi:MAG: imidazole glycerol phosphate synthase subunit HisH [Robiginitomaculum sp.]